MGGTGEIANQIAIAKTRRDHGEIMQMASAFPWVVRDVHVALMNIFNTQVTDEVADRFGHGVDVTGSASNGLSNHFAGAVEDTCRQVARFTDTGTECSTDEGKGLFFNNRNQAVPHDLQVYIGKSEACHVGAPSSLLDAK
ncbi:hypothetical protein D3C87_1527680 [compost metagenome]